LGVIGEFFNAYTIGLASLRWTSQEKKKSCSLGF